MSEFQALVRRAFQAAQRPGRARAPRMSIAVLKNRLLQLTDGAFHEAEFGASSFSSLLTRCNDFLSIDWSTRPPTAELIGGSPDAAGQQQSHPESTTMLQVIRKDLWDAVLDYSSGKEYQWDPQAQRANLVDRADQKWRVPQLGRADLERMRSDFLKSHRAKMPPAEQEALSDWAKNGWGTRALPKPLRGPWNSVLKRAVSEVLTGWLAGLGETPAQVFVPSSPNIHAAQSTELRRALHSLIDRMSPEELSSVQLPATLLIRLLQEKAPK